MSHIEVCPGTKTGATTNATATAATTRAHHGPDGSSHYMGSLVVGTSAQAPRNCTAALIGCRPNTGNTKDVPLDADVRERRAARIQGALIGAPHLPDERHAERLGVAVEFVTETRLAMWAAGGPTTPKSAHPSRSGEFSGSNRREILAAALKAEPELSDRAIARQVGCDHKTVAAHRKRMAASGEIPHHLRRVDPRSGRHTQPARRSAVASATVVEFLAAKAVAL